MNLFETERHLLLAIYEGQEVAEGEDYDTCVRLIGKDLVRGSDVSTLKGNKYDDLKVTAIGREVLGA
ncbi:hypothetical protein [Pseudomonas urmiensis]|uniref:hypothetical protein n=1 Tax=Pseudomonas urmiensis TaxID=2745493 RepID=UPI003C95A6D5